MKAADLVAVGHRVVHGGKRFHRPTLLDDAVIAELDELSVLAPLHNPPAIKGIEVARKLLPDMPQVAVFDTAFFHDLPPAAATYAIDRELAERWQIRRYGFHGTSHEYVSEQAAAFLDRPLDDRESDRAAPGQRRVGFRDRRRPSGRDIDGLDAAGGSGDGHSQRRHRRRRLSYLWRTAKMGVDEIESMLNKRSGVLGLCRGARLPRTRRDDRIRRQHSPIGV